MGREVDVNFGRELRRALRHYYEPTRLAASPLLACFDLDDQDDAMQALRRVLREGIESLRPDPGTPRHTEAWLLHQVLLQRYVQQFAQLAVADDLGISERHLRRLEGAAVGKLAECLWRRYDLGSRWQAASAPAPGDTEGDGAALETPSQEEELDWLRASLGRERVDVPGLLSGVLETIRPLLEASRVTVECRATPDLPSAVAETVVVRQALLSTLAAAVRAVPGGRVQIDVEGLGEGLGVRVAPAGQMADSGGDGSLEAARRLVGAFGGTLELAPGEDGEHPFVARLTLPTSERVGVLVIDDNPDTLQLMRRYLAGSRYSFTGTTDARQAVALAREVRPRLVVLDVMLPHIDGWELLGRLREHPDLRGVPVVVCSMLREEGLALALGAAAFIPKPVQRKALLAVLDEQLAPSSRGCG